MDNEVAKVCIWREDRNEPILGIEEVVWVIRNRMKKQNKTSYEIVTAHLQFSSMTFKADPQLTFYPTLSDTRFQTICHFYDVVMNSSDPDPTDGSTFYRNEATANSLWFDNAIKNGHLVKTVKVGNHTFYKEV